MEQAERASFTPALLVAALALLIVRPALGRLVPLAPVLVLAAVALLSYWAGIARDVASIPPVVIACAGVVAVLAAHRLGGRGVPVVATTQGVGLGVAAAVAEEALFRGALYAALSRAGALAAVIGTALMFALVHVPAYGIAAFPVDLGAGLLLSWQRWASGRWEPAAATHIFANVMAFIG